MELEPETRNNLALLRLLLKQAQKVLENIGDEAKLVHRQDPVLRNSIGWAYEAADALLRSSIPTDNNSSRVFYRKLYMLDVVSETSLAEATLEAVMRSTYDGDDVGDSTDFDEMEIVGQQAAELLYAMGSEPEFFQLEDDGSDAN